MFRTTSAAVASRDPVDEVFHQAPRPSVAGQGVTPLIGLTLEFVR